VSSNTPARQGLDPDFIRSLEKQFGFDKPAHERFLLMLWNFARIDSARATSATSGDPAHQESSRCRCRSDLDDVLTY